MFISLIFGLLVRVIFVRLAGRFTVLRLSVDGKINSSTLLSLRASSTSSTGNTVRSITPLRLVKPAMLSFLQQPNTSPLVLRSTRLGLL